MKNVYGLVQTHVRQLVFDQVADEALHQVIDEIWEPINQRIGIRVWQRCEDDLLKLIRLGTE